MDIDLLDQDKVSSGSVDAWSEWLRANAPVYRHPEPDGPGFWILSKHADVAEASRNAGVFSSAQENGGTVGLTAKDREPLLQLGKNLVTMDPPEHTEYRDAIGQAFRPQAIRSMEVHIREAASLVFDQCLQDGSVVELDVVEELVGLFTIGALAHVLGVPKEDWRRLYHLANVAAGFDDTEYAADRQAVDESIKELQEYGLELARRRRLRPEDDLVTRLAQAEVGGQPISDVAVMANMLLLLTAGHETTRAALLHGIDQLVDRPDQFAAIGRDPALVPTATEEMLRWSTPINYFRRAAVEDVEIRGQRIPAGSTVALWYFSANRDEEVFEDPYRFDITRTSNPHLAFGGGGPHYCVGSRLARLEIEAFLRELVGRVRSIDRTGPTVRLRSNLIRGIKHLPLACELR